MTTEITQRRPELGVRLSGANLGHDLGNEVGSHPQFSGPFARGFPQF